MIEQIETVSLEKQDDWPHDIHNNIRRNPRDDYHGWRWGGSNVFVSVKYEEWEEGEVRSLNYFTQTIPPLFLLRRWTVNTTMHSRLRKISLIEALKWRYKRGKGGKKFKSATNFSIFDRTYNYNKRTDVRAGGESRQFLWWPIQVVGSNALLYLI